MSYLTDGLTFNTLREANVKRLPDFKNHHGKPAHSQADGSDWSDAEWLQAVVGELGEYANLRKKMQRGDIEGEEAKQALADELADVVIYLDILAFRLGIDLGQAVADKWNATSRRVGSDLRIDANGWHHKNAHTDGCGAGLDPCEPTWMTEAHACCLCPCHPACSDGYCNAYRKTHGLPFRADLLNKP